MNTSEVADTYIGLAIDEDCAVDPLVPVHAYSMCSVHTHTYIHIYIYIYIYIYMYQHTHARTHARTHAHTHVHGFRLKRRLPFS